MAARKKPVSSPPKPDLLSAAIDEMAAGVEPGVAEVVTSKGHHLRIERVNSVAPMLQGVSAMFMVIPAAAQGVESTKAPSLLSPRDAQRMADIMQSVLLEAVTGTRGDESEPWKPLKLVARKQDHAPKEGRVWVGVLTDADQARCYDTLVKLHTGEGMATLIATAFQFAADRLAPALAGLAVRLRSLDRQPVES